MKMAANTTIFSDKETNNWFKMCVALNMTKEGLTNFVETIINKVHAALGSSCGLCSIEQLMACPTQGLCKKTKQNSCVFHKSYLPQPCQICNKVKLGITSFHRFSCPSWKNTKAQGWKTDWWEIAKCYLPPQGYTEVSSVQESDFNAVINIILNCKEFQNYVSSSWLSPPPPDLQCPLEKVRQIGRDVRHSANCKTTDAELQDYFQALTMLLADPVCLAHDPSANTALSRLNDLQNDRLPLTELGNLVQEAMQAIGRAKDAGEEQFSEKAKHTIEESLNKIKEASKDGERVIGTKMDESIQTINDRTKYCKLQIEDQTSKAEQTIKTKTCVSITHIDTLTKSSVQLIEDHSKESMARMQQKVTDKADEDYERGVEYLLQRIKRYYDKQFNNAYATNLSLDDRITNLYVSPSIHKLQIEKDGATEQIKLYTYRDILSTGENHCKQILLRGQAGTGKSTFVNKLVLDWCQCWSSSRESTDRETDFNDFETLQEFTFVFLIALRDSDTHRDITRNIKQQIIDRIYEVNERDKAYELLTHVLANCNCLIVEDGLDELADPEGLTALPKLSPSYDKCTVLTTTKHWEMTDEHLKQYEVGSLIELKGINEFNDLNKQILKCLLTSQVGKKQLMLNEYVRKYNIQVFASAPALYKMIVCAWLEGIQLTGSRCETYSALFDFLLKKASSSTAPFNPPPAQCFVNTQHIRPNIDLFNSLAELAFVQLFKSGKETNFLFKGTELSNCLDQEQKALALKVGILLERKIESISGSLTFSFIHKSMQVFLAAYYIASNVSATLNAISTYLCKYPDAFLTVYEVFVFVCGQDIQAGNALSKVIDGHNVLPEDTNFQVDTTIQDFIECGYDEAKANKERDENIHLQLSCCRCFDSKSIGTLRNTVKTKMSSSLRVLQIEQSKSEPDIFQQGEQCVLDVSIFPNLERLRSNVVTPLLLRTLTDCDKLNCLFLELDFCAVEDLDMSPYHSLQTLVILKHLIPSSTVYTLVSDEFYRLANLKNLTLKNINYTGLDLSAFHQLETIHITAERNGSPSESYSFVLDAFRSLVNLKHLTLINISHDGLDLSVCKQLETIHISTEFFHDSMHTLKTNAFELLVNLKCLTLNNVSHEGLDLSSCQKLETVHISRQEFIKFAGTPNDLMSDTFHGLVNLNRIQLKNLNFNALDLSSCHLLENVYIYREEISFNTSSTLLCDAFRALGKIKHLTLYNVNHDNLDLSSCHQLETISIRRDSLSIPNEMVPDAFHVLENLTMLTLKNIICEGLDLSACQQLTCVSIYCGVSLVPDSCCGLKNLDNITLSDITCDGLNLTSCLNLKLIHISGNVSLVPGAFRSMVKLKDLTLNQVRCENLDLSCCSNLENIHVHGDVSLKEEAFRVLVNLKRLTFVTFKSGKKLDLSSCPLLKQVDVRRYPVSRFTLDC